LKSLHVLKGGGCQGAAVFAGILYEGAQHNISSSQFHTIAATERIPYDAYCASPLLEPQVTESLRQALLDLKPNSPLAQQVLGKTSRITGFTGVGDSTYAPVRTVLRRLEAARKIPLEDPPPTKVRKRGR
jgi:ABC-type phosphate/phosphonate transport system substrate-binding protein